MSNEQKQNVDFQLIPYLQLYPRFVMILSKLKFGNWMQANIWIKSIVEEILWTE